VGIVAREVGGYQVRCHLVGNYGLGAKRAADFGDEAAQEIGGHSAFGRRQPTTEITAHGTVLPLAGSQAYSSIVYRRQELANGLRETATVRKP
jgi:hypothetical protein